MEKVCHVSTLHPLFDPRIFYRECYSLSQAGYDTNLIVSTPHNEKKIGKVHVHKIDVAENQSKRLSAKERFRRFIHAFKLVNQVDAKLYHLHDPELIPLGYWLKLRKKKVIFDCHENNTAYIDHKKHMSPFSRFLLKIYMLILEQTASCFFDAVFTADQGVADLYRTRYRAQNVYVIHNFPRLDLFSSGITSIPFKERKFDLIYHGSIPKYHLETAFAVESILRQDGILARWLFVGNTTVAEWAFEEIKKRGFQDTFTLIAKWLPADQIIEYIRQTKIGFIPLPDLPKFHHNIPTKLFEFMALGIPSVLSDLPASRPFVGDGKCAIIVPPGDYNAYAKAIRLLLSDIELYERMSRVGQTRTHSKYNWNIEEKKILDAYEKILGE